MTRAIDVTLAVGAVWLLALPVAAQQQTRPLLTAADRINSVTPQAVARQTIRLGRYDGSTKQFIWALAEEYPPNTPEYKKAENGGPVQPRRYADVNSYTLSYQIEVANKPANFSLALVFKDSDGQTITRPASIAGNVATVDVSPPAAASHEIRINQSGAPSLRFHARFADQLGAFVVPFLLVSIIYEPPGAGSVAEYSVTTTAGTSLTLEFSRLSGFVSEPAPTDTLMWAFNKAVGLYLENAWGKPGEFVKGVLEEIGGIQTNTVQLIVDTTVSTSQTEGHVLSITEGWATRANDQFVYPGNGDVFVILRDVLFVYVAYQGRIYMTPVAYSIDRGLIPSELPPDLVQAYTALDPHFSKNARGPVIAGKAGSMSPLDKLTLAGGSGIGNARRFRRLPNQPCEQNATKILEIVSTDYQISGGARAITKTTLERATGLVALATGSAGTTTTSVTYTSATENYSGTSTAPKIVVACEGERFEIEVFFDNLMGTFLTRRGPPLTTYAAVAGEASDAQGRPRPNQLVTLSIGDRSYRVRADASGRFQFPFSSIPTGRGTLRIGEHAYPVSFAGSPKRISVKGNSITELASSPDAVMTTPKPVPAGKPAARPRRP
jgi:hypothetical protein